MDENIVMRKKNKIDISSICDKQDIRIKINYDKLFILIEKSNISQCDFCDLANISRQTLERLRNGDNVSMSTLIKLLNALHKINNKKYYLEDIMDIKYY